MWALPIGARMRPDESIARPLALESIPFRPFSGSGGGGRGEFVVDGVPSRLAS